MTSRFVSRGFIGRRRDTDDRAGRTPPGQYLTDGFPVLSAGPTPQIPLDEWEFTIDGLVRKPVRWNWEQFQALPARDWTVDISCVTKWTKLDTRWHGASVDDLLAAVELDPQARFVTAHSYGGYTTNLPLTDVLNNQAFVAYQYDGAPLEPLSWNGVAPTVANLASGAYALEKRLYVAFRSSPRPAVRRFLRFLGSPQAQKILTEAGSLPLSLPAME